MTAQVWTDLQTIKDETETFRSVVLARENDLRKIAGSDKLHKTAMLRIEHGDWNVVSYLKTFEGPYFDNYYALLNLIALGVCSNNGAILITDNERKIIKACSYDPTEEIDTWISSMSERIDDDYEYWTGLNARRAEIKKVATIEPTPTPVPSKDEPNWTMLIVATGMFIGIVLFMLGVR